MLDSRSQSPLLSVSDLRVDIDSEHRVAHVLRGVSFSVGRGEIFGIVGESGSGKSMTCSALLGLLPRPQARITGGSIVFDGQELADADEKKWQSLRGRRISMIPQDPLGALNPVIKIGPQVTEALVHADGLERSGRWAAASAALRSVRLPDAERQLRRWPHQLSGGMRQRVVGAIAIAGQPDLVIADEATTALDSTIQLQFLDLLQSLRDLRGSSVIVITHDFGVVARICDRVAVMYAGRVVEEAPVEQIFHSPRHPYTKALLASVPRLDALPDRLASIEGSPPAPWRPVEGCSFRPRCSIAIDACLQSEPPSTAFGAHHLACCWRAR